MKPWVRHLYADAIARAEFYRWAAARRFPLSRDPMTGAENRTDVAREAEAAANKAAARVWLQHAATLRESK